MVELVKFYPIRKPIPMSDDYVLRARFTCRIDGVRHEGCGLLHRQNKGWSVWPPAGAAPFSAEAKRQLKALARQEFYRQKMDEEQ